MLEEAEVYTDGSCKGNPGPGGWSFVQMEAGAEVWRESGHERSTTNNRMELQAVIEVLATYPVTHPVHVLTDSTYVAKGVGKWLAGWKRAGWRRRDKGPVANVDLWQRLDELRQGRQLRFSWIKGHADVPGNVLADRYAQAEAQKAAAG